MDLSQLQLVFVVVQQFAFVLSAARVVVFNQFLGFQKQFNETTQFNATQSVIYGKFQFIFN